MGLILLDTKQALQGTPSKTPHDTLFVIEEAVTNNDNSFYLESVIIPNLRYNIHAGNNTIIYNQGGASTTVTIPVGEYTDATLITAVIAALAPITGVPNVSQSTLTDIITVDSFTGSLTFEVGSTLCEQVLGFELPASAAATPLVGSYPMTLQSTQYIDVCAIEFTTNSASTGKIGNVLARIPCQVQYGSTIFWENPVGSSDIQVASAHFQQVQIRLRDDRERLFELPANAHCTFTFRTVTVS